MSIEAALTLHDTQLKNRVFIALVVLSNSIGNLLLGFAMERMPDFSKTAFLAYIFAAGTNVWLLLGMVLMIVYMIAQLSMYSWADLSYVLPVTASTYIVSALLSKFFLHETVSAIRWFGIVLISFGVIFVAETPIREEEEETESVPG